MHKYTLDGRPLPGRAAGGAYISGQIPRPSSWIKGAYFSGMEEVERDNERRGKEQKGGQGQGG